MSTPEIIEMLNDAQSFGIGVYNAWTVEPLIILVPLEEFIGNKHTARITVIPCSQFLLKTHSISEVWSVVKLFFLKPAGTKT